MKAVVIKENKNIATLRLGESVEIIPNMEADADDVAYGNASGKCFLCRTSEGKHIYFPATHLLAKREDSLGIDWEQRRYEIAKEIYPHVINRANIKQLERVGSSTVKLADLLIGALKGNEPTENPAKGAKMTKDVPIGEKVLIDGLEYICLDAKDEDCCSCDFLVDGDCKSPSWLCCHMENRDDKKDVKFKIIKQ